MESPLSFFRMHWDYEPGLARSSRRESAQASPMKNERTHVRCYTTHGESREAFSSSGRSSSRRRAAVYETAALPPELRRPEAPEKSRESKERRRPRQRERDRRSWLSRTGPRRLSSSPALPS